MKRNSNEVQSSKVNEKSGTQTGHKSNVSQFPQDLAASKKGADRAAKSSVEYWKVKVTPRVVRGIPTAELYVRLREGGRDTWICLDTANRATAADKARNLWLSVKGKGLEVALAEFHPKAAPRAARAATVGELLTEAKAVSTVRASTLAQYEVSLRRLVAGLLGMNPTGSVFYHKSPEAKAWRDRVEGASLGILSDLRVEAWRKAYVADCADEKARISRKNTAAAVIRNARAFFAPSFAKAIGEKIRLPSPLPLVTLPIGSSTRRFKTNVDPRKLYAEALKDLTGDVLTAFLLCITAGLRRGEADMLEWQAVNLDAALVHIAPTKWFLPKTEESQRATPIPPDVVAHLRAARAADPSAEFVLRGLSPEKKRAAKEYRCACWRPLLDWLRVQEFVSPNPIHELRKLSGSLVNATAGLEAARRHLGHRNISTTAASYVTGSAALVDLSARTATTEGGK